MGGAVVRDPHGVAVVQIAVAEIAGRTAVQVVIEAGGQAERVHVVARRGRNLGPDVGRLEDRRVDRVGAAHILQIAAQPQRAGPGTGAAQRPDVAPPAVVPGPRDRRIGGGVHEVVPQRDRLLDPVGQVRIPGGKRPGAGRGVPAGDRQRIAVFVEIGQFRMLGAVLHAEGDTGQQRRDGRPRAADLDQIRVGRQVAVGGAVGAADAVQRLRIDAGRDAEERVRGPRPAVRDARMRKLAARSRLVHGHNDGRRQGGVPDGVVAVQPAVLVPAVHGQSSSPVPHVGERGPAAVHSQRRAGIVDQRHERVAGEEVGHAVLADDARDGDRFAAAAAVRPAVRPRAFDFGLVEPVERQLFPGDQFRRQLVGLVVQLGVSRPSHAGEAAVVQPQIETAEIALEIAGPILRAAVVQQAVQIGRIRQGVAELELVDLRQVLRHDRVGVERAGRIGFAAQLGRHGLAVVDRRVRVVQPRQHLVVLVERAHRPRVGDGQRPPFAFDHRFELQRQPVDLLPPAQDVALPHVAGHLGMVETVRQARDLAFAGLAQAPDVQPPAELVGQVALELGFQLLDANRIVFAGVQVLGDEIARRGYVTAGIRRIDLEPREVIERIGGQLMEKPLVLDVGPQLRSRKIPACLRRLAVGADQGKVGGPQAGGAPMVHIPERRGMQILVLADHDRRTVDDRSPPAGAQRGLAVQARLRTAGHELVERVRDLRRGRSVRRRLVRRDSAAARRQQQGHADEPPGATRTVAGTVRGLNPPAERL